jgi:starch synthase
LAQGIEQALEDEGRRGKMGKAGRERVESLFSWRRVAERTVRVYEELIP